MSIPTTNTATTNPPAAPVSAKHQVIYLGAGCFWCTEAVFENIDGVVSVQSGFQGGTVNNPTYEEVCSGSSGHAEVCKLTYAPETVSLETILDTFWIVHDPTSLNRQGADVGTQYRSAIFCPTPEQLAVATAARDNLDASGTFPRPIVTEVALAPEFYPAGQNHQDYYSRNSSQPYCRFVIAPKLKKAAEHKATNAATSKAR